VLGYRKLDIVFLRDLGCLLAGVDLVHVGQLYALGSQSSVSTSPKVMGTPHSAH
jgi:hypothetical protein